MLSRVAASKRLVSVGLTNARGTSSAPVVWKREVLEGVKEGPERDLVNFPRYKRPEHPGPVRLGFIPEEWFQFFYPKTGLTGPYLFGAGLVMTLLSKEIVVIEDEFLFGISLFTSIGLLHKLYGKDVAEYIDKGVDQEIAEWKQGTLDEVKMIDDTIAHEELCQVQSGAQKYVFEVKKENVGLQLEAEFRKRQLQVYQEVKKKLDYHLETMNIERRLQQRHMVDWIVDNVSKSISAQHEKDALGKCIADLKSLAARA